MRRFMYKMHPAGFGRTTLKLSDKYKLITRQLLYASLWIRFRWMKSSASFCLLFFILLYSKLILDKVGIAHNCKCLFECIIFGKSMNRWCRIWHNTFWKGIPTSRNIVWYEWIYFHQTHIVVSVCVSEIVFDFLGNCIE